MDAWINHLDELVRQTIAINHYDSERDELHLRLQDGEMVQIKRSLVETSLGDLAKNFFDEWYAQQSDEDNDEPVQADTSMYDEYETTHQPYEPAEATTHELTDLGTYHMSSTPHPDSSISNETESSSIQSGSYNHQPQPSPHSFQTTQGRSQQEYVSCQPQTAPTPAHSFFVAQLQAQSGEIHQSEISRDNSSEFQMVDQFNGTSHFETETNTTWNSSRDSHYQQYSDPQQTFDNDQDIEMKDVPETHLQNESPHGGEFSLTPQAQQSYGNSEREFVEDTKTSEPHTEENQSMISIDEVPQEETKLDDENGDIDHVVNEEIQPETEISPDHSMQHEDDIMMEEASSSALPLPPDASMNTSLDVSLLEPPLDDNEDDDVLEDAEDVDGDDRQTDEDNLVRDSHVQSSTYDALPLPPASGMHVAPVQQSDETPETVTEPHDTTKALFDSTQLLSSKMPQEFGDMGDDFMMAEQNMASFNPFLHGWNTNLNPGIAMNAQINASLNPNAYYQPPFSQMGYNHLQNDFHPLQPSVDFLPPPGTDFGGTQAMMQPLPKTNDTSGVFAMAQAQLLGAQSINQVAQLPSMPFPQSGPEEKEEKDKEDPSQYVRKTEEVSADGKDYECTRCGKKYAARANCRRHVEKKHTGSFERSTKRKKTSKSRERAKTKPKPKPVKPETRGNGSAKSSKKKSSRRSPEPLFTIESPPEHRQSKPKQYKKRKRGERVRTSRISQAGIDSARTESFFENATWVQDASSSERDDDSDYEVENRKKAKTKKKKKVKTTRRSGSPPRKKRRIASESTERSSRSKKKKSRKHHHSSSNPSPQDSSHSRKKKRKKHKLPSSSERRTKGTKRSRSPRRQDDEDEPPVKRFKRDDGTAEPLFSHQIPLPTLSQQSTSTRKVRRTKKVKKEAEKSSSSSSGSDSDTSSSSGSSSSSEDGEDEDDADTNTDAEEKLKCPYCDDTWKGSTGLKNHLRMHNDIFPCEFCDNLNQCIFDSFDELNDHTKDVHQNRYKREVLSSKFFCFVCLKKCSTSAGLQSHGRCHGEVSAEYKPKIASQKARNVVNDDVLAAVRQKRPPHPKPMNGNAPKSVEPPPTQLIDAETSDHSSSGRKKGQKKKPKRTFPDEKLKCEFCYNGDKTYKNRQGLGSHVKIAHPEKYERYRESNERRKKKR